MTEVSRVNLFLHAENTRIFGTGPKRTLPVTLITGFLGAGKTTLINHILHNKSNLRVAAAINDFADLNIDEDLVRSKNTTEKIVELSNGCVCCQLLGNLETSVWDLLKDGSDVDLDNINYLLIETSGVSDPSRIIKSLDAKFGKMYRARLDSVVTVIDSDALRVELETVDRSSDASKEDSTCTSKSATKEKGTRDATSTSEHDNTYSLTEGSAALSQIKHADILLLNKKDLVDTETLDSVKKYVNRVNPEAAIYFTKNSNVPLSCILDVEVPSSIGGPTTITHEGTAVPVYISATGGALRKAHGSSGSAKRKDETRDHHHHQKKDSVSQHMKQDQFTTVSFTVDKGPLDIIKLSKFLRQHLPLHLVRMKGVLWLHSNEYDRCVVHMSGRHRLGYELDGTFVGPPKSTIAFIGKNLNGIELEKLFQQLVYTDAGTATNSSSSSVASDRITGHFNNIFETYNGSSNGNEWFRLTGEGVYGYNSNEITNDLRIDINQMNLDFMQYINVCVTKPRVFLSYCYLKNNDKKDSKEGVWLCASGGTQSICGNDELMFEIGMKTIKEYFRNVTSCKCGT